MTLIPTPPPPPSPIPTQTPPPPPSPLPLPPTSAPPQTPTPPSPQHPARPGGKTSKQSLNSLNQHLMKYESSQKKRKEFSKSSLIKKLLRDGRKTPSVYRRRAIAAISPSQLSFKTLSEHYNLPDANFKTPDDVFKYRGYRKVCKIDEGAFGIVSKAQRIVDNKELAVKEVDLRRKRNKRIEEMKRELFVLQKIQHPNIVRLVEHFVVGHTLAIIMEFCAGSNLTSYLKDTNIGEEEVLRLFKQMATGIMVLHKKGISHRDVKLNNFLLDAKRKVVKISDFGLSVVSYKPQYGLVMAKTYCGTEPYMAPELLKRNKLGFRSYYPIYADIWSLGICLYAMLTRTFPFKMQLSQRGLYKAQVTRKWKFPKSIKGGMNEEIKDLVWHMLDPEPERRITITGVLSHPWINKDQVFQLSSEDAKGS